jgi:hypothetical protein
MNKHTPGPWSFTFGTQVRSKFDMIAKVWMMRDGEGIANAQLIAAAPDLLAALQSAICIIVNECDTDEYPKHIADIRAAISKATGETS